jgi:DNA-binding response OmpR family regulator
METGRVLIVDDEVNIRNGLRAVLAKAGHIVKDVGSGEEAITALDTFETEVAIVDIRMPGMSGVELLHEIGKRWPAVSVILLTGHGTLETAMTAVKEGAHDYLLKPAQPKAILDATAKALTASRRQREQARLFESIRSGMARLGELPDSPPAVEYEPKPADTRRQITVGDLFIDLQAHQVRKGDAIIALTPSEFQLLVALAERKGDVVDYVTLVQLALDYDAEPWEAKELIKRHVFALRQKIELEPSAPQYILNVRGIGYRLTSP